jgi:hypothetical protein
MYFFKFNIYKLYTIRNEAGFERKRRIGYSWKLKNKENVFVLEI